jgi:hypothetical protein
MKQKRKKSTAKFPGAGKAGTAQRALPPNTALHAQTRRVLGQHYRAKYGVK